MLWKSACLLRGVLDGRAICQRLAELAQRQILISHRIVDQRAVGQHRGIELRIVLGLDEGSGLVAMGRAVTYAPSSHSTSAMFCRTWAWPARSCRLSYNGR